MNLFNSRQYRTYENIIALLYRCRSIEELQFILINEVDKLIPSDSSILMFFEDDGITAKSSMLNNLDDSSFNDYLNHYQYHDSYKKQVHQLAVPPAVNRASDFLEYPSWENNEHRVDFLLPQGIYHIACLELISNQKIMASLSLHRVKQHHDFEDREMNVLQLLAPLFKTTYQYLKPVSQQRLFPGDEKLTVRERQILPLLSSGYANEELADMLGISINTLKTHIKHILHKFDSSSRIELFNKIQQARSNNRADQ